MENVPLRQLLLDLVSSDEGLRDAAARRVMPIKDEAQQAVRDAVNAPGFPFAEWYAALHDVMVQHGVESDALRERSSERKKAAEARIEARYAAAVAAEEQAYTSSDEDDFREPRPVSQKMWHRRRQVSSAGTREETLASRLTRQKVSAHFVFRSLREETLRDPEPLRALLADPRERYVAEEMLANLGTAGADLFADDLLERVATEGFRSSTTAKAVKAMLAGDEPRIRRVAEWLSASDPARRANAIRILRLFGTEAARIAPNTVPALFTLAQTGHNSAPTGNGERIAALYALGALTQDTDVAVDFLLAQSESVDVWIKRAALTALGTIVRQPERVVPRLIRAFTDYEEPDSDSLYHGSHQVVTDGLRAFGSAAAEAVPALVGVIVSETDLSSDGTTEVCEIDPV